MPQVFEERGVRGFFTTRQFSGGLEAVAALFGDGDVCVYAPLQRHTDIAISVRTGSLPVVADAVVSDVQTICVAVQVADCVPILIYDERNNVTAAVHAGWRGTAREILPKTIRHMADHHGSRPGDMVVAIGPSIGVCCYEVGREVVDAFCRLERDWQPTAVDNGKYYADLREINRLQSLRAGIRHQNLWISGECTHCNPEKFHSYRRNGQRAGRQYAFIVPRRLL